MYTMSEVKSKCKKCGREAESSKFSLDPVIGSIVCPQCVHERKLKAQVYKELEQEKYRQKTGNEPRSMVLNETKKAPKDAGIPKITEKTRKTCYKCKYKFPYDAINDTPKVCPYCNSDVNDRYAFR